MNVARPALRRGAARARRPAPDPRRLGRHAARPRRARLHRPARPRRDLPARDQPRARARGARRRARDPQRVRPPRRGRGRRPRARGGQPGAADRRGRAPGRHARDRLALPAAPVPARRGERRRDAAPPLPLARPAPPAPPAQHPAARADGRRDPPDDGERRSSSTSRRRSCSSRRPRARATSSSRAGCRRAASTRCRSRPRSSSSCSIIAGFDRYYQIAICFRDEDLRADRVQEITQLDVEMAFPDQELIFGLMEQMCVAIWRECIGVDLSSAVSADDLRRGDGALRDATSPTCASGSRSRTQPSSRAARASRSSPTRRASASCGCRRSSRARSSPRSRSEQRSGARRASRTSSTTRRARCARRSPSSSPRRSSTAFAGEPATTVLFGADEPKMVARVLGALRTHLGRESRPDRREPVRVPLDHRLPDVRLVGGGRPLGRRPPPVHAADAGVGGALRPGARARRPRTPTT